MNTEGGSRLYLSRPRTLHHNSVLEIFKYVIVLPIEISQTYDML